MERRPSENTTNSKNAEGHSQAVDPVTLEVIKTNTVAALRAVATFVENGGLTVDNYHSEKSLEQSSIDIRISGWALSSKNTVKFRFLQEYGPSGGP